MIPSESQKQAYYELGEKGKPILFLHHSFASYQYWPEYTGIIGGKYHLIDSAKGLSHYKHDVVIEVKIEDPNHPITSGLNNFTVFDETYGNTEIVPKVHPLLSTEHPLSMPYLAWTHTFVNSEIVFIQLGHGYQIFEDQNYRRLVYQAIKWCIANNPGSRG